MPALQQKALELLYTHTAGRMLLRPFVSRPFSDAMGALLETRLSSALVPLCAKRLGIDLDEYEPLRRQSFNAFFTRQLKPGMRTLDPDPLALISPCDGLATVLPLGEDTRFYLKGTPYSLALVLGSEKLAAGFSGGYVLILRLCVENYHRYCYAVSGEKSADRRIAGEYHTVNPIANDYYPIYRQNTREYTLLTGAPYGRLIQMEVGALCVGRIVNYHPAARSVRRGEEKGRFEFGGSTIVLFTEPDRLLPDERLLEASAAGEETPVRIGEALGRFRG